MVQVRIPAGHQGGIGGSAERGIAAALLGECLGGDAGVIKGLPVRRSVGEGIEEALLNEIPAGWVSELSEVPCFLGVGVSAPGAVASDSPP